MRRAARTDRNHDEIRTRFRYHGYSWDDLFRLGQGRPDGVVAGKWLGKRNVFVEVKFGNEDLTDDEAKFHREWPGEIIIVRTVEQVDILDAIWRNGAKKGCPDNTGK